MLLPLAYSAITAMVDMVLGWQNSALFHVLFWCPWHKVSCQAAMMDPLVAESIIVIVSIFVRALHEDQKADSRTHLVGAHRRHPTPPNA